MTGRGAGTRGWGSWMTGAVGRLPLFWKLLAPGLAVTLVIGVLALFASTRFLTEQVRDEQDRELLRAGVEASAEFRDAELILSEAARVAANLTGVPEAAAAGDAEAAREQLVGLAAVRTRVELVALTDLAGTGLVEVTRQGTDLSIVTGTTWSPSADFPVADDRDVAAVFLSHRGRTLLAIVTRVEADAHVGWAIAGMTLDELVSGTAARLEAGVAMYTPDGDLLASSVTDPPAGPPTRAEASTTIRVRETIAGEPAGVIYEPVTRDESRLGMLAVAIPQPSPASEVRGTALWLTLLVLVGMGFLAGLYAALARGVSGRVRDLAVTSRRIGRGDLEARADVLGDDELSELAERLNRMAEQLQAGQAELEMQVEARTEELRRLYSETQRLPELQGDTLGEIAHELRNPIFTIATHAQLMIDEKQTRGAPDWVRDGARSIHASAEDVLRQVNDLLELARPSASETKLDLEPVTVRKEMEPLRRVMEALAERGDVEFEMDVPERLPRIRADRARLRQILLNLGSNAVKYTPPGGRVLLAASNGHDHVSISISDTGVGIPPDAMRHLFEPFYRVEGTKAQRGEASSGLGLAITKRLVDAHEGTISVESEEGKGSTFTVSFPVHKARRQAGTRAAGA